MRSACSRAASRSSTGRCSTARPGPRPSASSLAPILSPSARMTSPVGPTKVMPSCSHSGRRSRRARRRTPSRPRRRRRCCPECPRELVVVEVGGPGPGGLTRTGSDADRLVGLADEHRVPLRVGVQRDRAGSGAVGVAERAHGVDQPHRRLATVDDGDALEHGGLLRGAARDTAARGAAPRRRHPRPDVDVRFRILRPVAARRQARSSSVA
jgi:hypothetical protein